MFPVLEVLRFKKIEGIDPNPNASRKSAFSIKREQLRSTISMTTAEDN